MNQTNSMSNSNNKIVQKLIKKQKQIKFNLIKDQVLFIQHQEKNYKNMKTNLC